MCMGGSSTPKQAPPSAPPATPALQTPDQADSTSTDSVTGTRKAGSARKGLRIDLVGGAGSGGSGINLPLD